MIQITHGCTYIFCMMIFSMMGHGKRKVTSTKRQRPNPKLDYEPVDDDVGESSVAGGEDG